MTVEYTKKATLELAALGTASRQQFGDTVAAEVATFIRQTIDQIRNEPFSRPKVSDRSGVHVAALVRYPFKIFYRVFDDRIRILHIRHTAQRPWEGN